jgi:hypothetical protein
MSAERALPVDERPTVPAPDSEAERSFEAEVQRISGGSWSQIRVRKPIRKEGLLR